MTTSHIPSPNKKSSFTNAKRVLCDEKQYGRNLYAFYGLAFDIGCLGSDVTIKVPDGFKSDGPSWPLWVDNLLIVIKAVMRWIGLERYIPSLPDLHMILSSAIHDYVRERLVFPKVLGDIIFLNALKVEGCSFVFRWLAFLAVSMNFSRNRCKDSSFVLTESE